MGKGLTLKTKHICSPCFIQYLCLEIFWKQKGLCNHFEQIYKLYFDTLNIRTRELRDVKTKQQQNCQYFEVWTSANLL